MTPQGKDMPAASSMSLPESAARAVASLQPAGGSLELLDLDHADDLLANAAWLSTDENERAARFVTESLRRRYRCAHVFTRARLAGFTGLAPGQLQFNLNPWGKPALHPNSHRQSLPHFSLSHSHQLALLAICPDQAIGADIELLKPFEHGEMRSMARTIMTPAEQTAFTALLDENAPATDPSLAFLTAWTRKEACIKALGLGLTYPVSQLDTGFDTGERHITMNAVVSHEAAPTVWLQTRRLTPLAVISIAQVVS